MTRLEDHFCLCVELGFLPYSSIWPLRMRLGVVPVSVAVPPMLAE